MDRYKNTKGKQVFIILICIIEELVSNKNTLVIIISTEWAIYVTSFIFGGDCEFTNLQVFSYKFVLQGLGLQVVENVDEAEFILAHGTEALGLPSGTSLPLTLEDLEEILKRCAVKNIPMVVANPDFVTVEARALRVMPGKDVYAWMIA